MLTSSEKSGLVKRTTFKVINCGILSTSQTIRWHSFQCFLVTLEMQYAIEMYGTQTTLEHKLNKL